MPQKKDTSKSGSGDKAEAKPAMAATSDEKKGETPKTKANAGGKKDEEKKGKK